MITLLIVIGTVLLVLIPILMYLSGYNLITTVAVGGILAAGFWLVHAFQLGLKERPFEYFAALSWMTFSLIVLVHDY
jgi:hypothetical protein